MSKAICMAVGCTDPRRADEVFCAGHISEWEDPVDAPAKKRDRAPRAFVLCSSDGCTRAVSAKGLCSRCYKRSRRAAGKEAPLPWGADGPVAVPCTACGAPVVRWVDARRQPFCSWDCRADYQYGLDRPGRVPRKRELHPRPRRVFADVVVSDAVPVDSEGIGKLSFSIDPSVRYAIYDRDKWVCQLCMEPVDPTLVSPDPWSASLDHIECQSWVLVPDHSPANLRLAHRWCNSARNDERHYTAEDLATSVHVAELRALSQRRTARSRGIDRNKLWWTTPARAYL